MTAAARPWQAPASTGASSSVDMQFRARACVTRLALWVTALGDAMQADGRKVAILDIGDRRRIVEAHAWAGRWLAAGDGGTVYPSSVPGGPLTLHVPMGTLGEDDADGGAVGIGFHVVGPDSRDAYYVEKLAHRYRLLLPEHLRPERAPSRRSA